MSVILHVGRLAFLYGQVSGPFPVRPSAFIVLRFRTEVILEVLFASSLEMVRGAEGRVCVSLKSSCFVSCAFGCVHIRLGLGSLQGATPACANIF